MSPDLHLDRYSPVGLAAAARPLADRAVPDRRHQVGGVNRRLAADVRKALSSISRSQDDDTAFTRWKIETLPWSWASLPAEAKSDPHVRRLWTRIQALDIAATALGARRARILAELRLAKGDLARWVNIEPCPS